MDHSSNEKGFHEYTKESEVFGTHIKKLRQYNHLTLNDVESKSGISHDYLQQLENGDVHHPSDLDMKRLAEVYNVDVATLISITETKVPDQD